MILQRTIQNEVSTVGVGLHTGEMVKIVLCRQSTILTISPVCRPTPTVLTSF